MYAERRHLMFLFESQQFLISLDVFLGKLVRLSVTSRKKKLINIPVLS